jgi:hypothetical protein
MASHPSSTRIGGGPAPIFSASNGIRSAPRADVSSAGPTTKDRPRPRRRARTRSRSRGELPDPSDSGPSYWLARTVWALGEGQPAFDGPFAGFLRERLDLAIGALERQVLSRYGEWQIVDGQRVPAWLIVDGADATAEAMLGLAAHDSARARRALRRFA